jgi:hypothetical protein
MTNIVRLGDRLAALEGKRRPAPDPQRLAETSARLVEVADAVTGLEELAEFRRVIALARAGAR